MTSPLPDTPRPALPDILAAIDGWGATHAAAALVGADGVIASHGPLDHRFAWASVTKLVTAIAVLRAVEDGRIDLDEACGPPASTVRHLLAHASGLPFEGLEPISRPAARRIYSNPGFDLLGDLLAERDGAPDPATALHERVLAPLGLHATQLVERPSQGLHGPLRDLALLGRELLRPTLIGARTHDAATTVAFPGLAGVLPGVGNFAANDWGLGFELRDAKVPHWTGTSNSPGTYGHFGGRGSFLWVDPAIGVALACLTDRPFGPWSLEAWPALSDAVVDAVNGAPGPP